VRSASYVTAATQKLRQPSYFVGVDCYCLNDGTVLEIRPIRADDRERLQVAHGRLSPESRYRRFLGAKPELTEADARYLADVDGSNHFALVATATVDGERGAIVAVARFVRASDDPTSAEFAIVVGDSFQRHGLAAALIERLAAAATERGITRFRTTMLSGNVAIFRLLEQLAEGELQVVTEGEISEVEIELPAAIEVRAKDTRAMIAGCPGSSPSARDRRSSRARSTISSRR
jgi:RimJ/RimL family protein N-acetyltransferase